MASYSVTNNPYNAYKYSGNLTPHFRGTHVEPRTSTPIPPPNKPDTVSFKASETNIEYGKKEGLSNGAKLALGIGLATVVAVGTYLITKGKKKIKLSSEQEAKLAESIKQGKLDEKHAEIFKSIEHFEGEEFIKEAYKRLAKSMGYENYPKLSINKNARTSSSGHGYSIELALKGFDTKEKQIGALRHELEHFRQDDLMYRAFGKNAVIEAHSENMKNVLLRYDEELCMKCFNKKYSELTPKEIEEFISKRRKHKEFINVDLFESILKQKGKIEVGSAEYKEAEQYLKATREYICPTNLLVKGEKLDLPKLEKENKQKYNAITEAFEIYINSPLENGAKNIENKILEMYKAFKEAIK